MNMDVCKHKAVNHVDTLFSAFTNSLFSGMPCAIGVISPPERKCLLGGGYSAKLPLRPARLCSNTTLEAA